MEERFSNENDPGRINTRMMKERSDNLNKKEVENKFDYLICSLSEMISECCVVVQKYGMNNFSIENESVFVPFDEDIIINHHWKDEEILIMSSNGNCYTINPQTIKSFNHIDELTDCGMMKKKNRLIVAELVDGKALIFYYRLKSDEE